MNITEKYLHSLLSGQGMESQNEFEAEFADFASQKVNIDYVAAIRHMQNIMTKNWQLIARRHEIERMPIPLQNGMAGKPYREAFSPLAMGIYDITWYSLEGFEDTGLVFNQEAGQITGLPERAGDIRLTFSYRLQDEPEDAAPNTRAISIIINHDPRSLWKEMDSDPNGSYAKTDVAFSKVSLDGIELLAASRRGRSHAQNGAYREDDYSFAALADGWMVVAVSDGAGSARFSRKGSELACEAVIGYFINAASCGLLPNERAIADALEGQEPDELLFAMLRDMLDNAARYTHKELVAFAAAGGLTPDELNATLSFSLIKQCSTKWLVFSFGVGDCPIVAVKKDFSGARLLNRMDTGEFGGGTRFITMPGIFEKDDYRERFSIYIAERFPYLVLMTDGVYDAKFEVEANLGNAAQWEAFFADLDGDNETGVSIGLCKRNTDERALAKWLNYWSPGNHDDRTLLLLY